MTEITLKIKRATVLLSQGTDLVMLTLDAPTPFPNMGYDGCIKVDVQQNYGEEWCKKVLGVTPEVIQRPKQY